MTKKMLLVLFLLLSAALPARALCVLPLCTCTLTTANVAFGSYNPMSFSPTDSTGSVSVSCGGVAGLLIPMTVAISTGSSGSYGTRKLRSGANTLDYNLYTDASYTTILGDGSGATQLANLSLLLDVLGLAPAQTVWVYGRIPARQLAAVPGVYADTINVTLTYY
ncbi:spore coat U domain-containing protein [Pelomonas sp. KK5]|uniref:Csu type fimbrial protein n=1 Tax=Pelomonas sp. KK5 TaxID=1855730 RepID=UPI00097C6A26|nr:spore coat U domain-containing protein [Pelomonas sp. KK5]